MNNHLRLNNRRFQNNLTQMINKNQLREKTKSKVNLTSQKADGNAAPAQIIILKVESSATDARKVEIPMILEESQDTCF